MSRSLIISLVATVVAGSAQAGVKQQASELFGSVVTKAAPYVTAKNAGIVVATGVVGYGLKKAYNRLTAKPVQVAPSKTTKEAEDTCNKVLQGAKKNAATLKEPSRLSRIWANRPSLKTVGKVVAAAAVVGGAYYFRGGLSTVASKVWNAMPSKESVMSIKPTSFFSKNS